MENTAHKAIAIVGLGAVLPDAPNVPTFWENIKQGRYSVTEVSPQRWDPALYYDPDPLAPDKTYSKIGGWVREHQWDPRKWKLPIPPRVADAMDEAQQWAISCTRAALEDYGWPQRSLDGDRTAVILGSAIAGEKQYYTVLRAYFPEYERELAQTPSFAALPQELREKLGRELHERVGHRFPEITEDTMPGELANCIAGRIANLFNFHGPNFVTDAACASAMAGITAAMEGLRAHDFDAAITGGVDRNMGPSTYIKFCKIGALSATGTRPFADGADGFVMGEGAALFLLKRLEDAERDGDKIYAVLLGMGASSDGKGKGITAPNPIGQKFATERGWQDAGVAPTPGTYVEGHGTSTKVGDLVEMESLMEVLKPFHLPPHSVALGSVKSNLGHLKGAAGAAGVLKTVLSLHHKMLAPSINCEHTNPGVDFTQSPLYVNTELKPWEVPADSVRRAGVSAFGFGGTNFHAVLEEYISHRITGGNGKRNVTVAGLPAATMPTTAMDAAASSPAARAEATLKAPLRGALVIGSATAAELTERLRPINKDAEAGRAPAPASPAESDLRAPERIVIDYADAAELADKSARALKALAADQPAMWKALRAKGICRGRGPAPKVAFLYTGQGSQYVNMLKSLRATEPIVTQTFAEADRIMTPLLGKPLSEFIFVEKGDADAVARAEHDLKQTEITQPAVLATDIALTRLLATYGIEPDMTMGHSLGEYGALVAAGALPFHDALQAVSARGRGMAEVSVADKGRMAAVFAPIAEIEHVLKGVNGYVVIANINSNGQAVIGGASQAVEEAMAVFQKAGYHVAALPVSHAFHTSIVAGASAPLRRVLERLHLQAARIPVIANVNGEFYPTGRDVVPQMVEILARQVASPVQFIKGLETLYQAGARVFIETGPKRALQGFVDDVLGGYDDVVSLATNHPKNEIAAFNQALCGLYAAGLGRGQAAPRAMAMAAAAGVSVSAVAQMRTPETAISAMPATVTANTPPAAHAPSSGQQSSAVPANGDRHEEVGMSSSEIREPGSQKHGGGERRPDASPIVITGAALGLPGTEHIFDDGNLERMLRGDQFIKPIPMQFRQAMLDKHITRLVKSENGGRFETTSDINDVIKLAARGGAFDLEQEFGLSGERVAALDRVTQLAIGAGLDALCDAGIPLVMRYKTTTKGTQLPDRWMLPQPMRDVTGVIFGSAFPGLESLSEEIERYHTDHARHEQVAAFEDLRTRVSALHAPAPVLDEIGRRIAAMQEVLEREPYVFERRFLWRVLSMGHSQFAEYIGARGPNTQINSACATTTQAVSLAEDWIRAGRCRHVIIISADDVTSDHMLEWIGAGFLASGAAATDEKVEDAAIPFDRRRHGLIIGMGAAALVVEHPDAARERGLQPICEILSAVTANSAYHGSRLDVTHIGEVMERLLAQAEAEAGIERHAIAPHTVFVSHETYTPARGGSASAEVHALRRVFGEAADQIVIANTKGFTGHAMGTGMEDVVAIKALETGLVPPVANFKEVDPEFGSLNLSKGGAYPIQYALHLGAGFGSQISMELLRWVPTKDGVRRAPGALGYAYRIVDPAAWGSWLSHMSGTPQAELEVVKHTLRVKDQRRAAHTTSAAAEARPAPKVEAPQPIAAPVIEMKAPKPEPPKPRPAVEVKVVAAVAPKTEDASVKDRVLAIVSSKTGYPIDMLDLDLDLEADLGVDTVKQAEVFAAVREAYGIARDDQLKLRDFPTLAHVIQFVHDRRPHLVSTTSAEAVKVTIPLATPAPAATAPAVAAADTGDAVRERVLALVVEKTGYPQDMLDLDLDLEADLGVDTVKQAEIFAAIRETYNIPRDENRKLRDYPTLAHVIRFVFEQRPDLAAKPAATPKLEPATPAPHAVQLVGEDVKAKVLAIVTGKTGYPEDMLDMDLDLEADLGVDTVKQAEIFAAIRESYNIPRDENRKLRDYPTLTHVIRFVYEQRPDLAGTPHETAAPTPMATPATVTAAPVATAAVAEQALTDDVKEKVLAIVTEKTGYPQEMLDLDLDLEADLGVDTVKQAEIFAAIRETYNIPRDENRKLRDYPTLTHVIRFVFEQRPDLAGTVAAPAAAAPAPVAATAPIAQPQSAAQSAPVATAAPAPDAIREKVLQIVAEKTGYPQDMLDLDLDLEADLGIDTVKQAEMFAAVRAAYDIPRDDNLKLREFPTLAHVIKFAQDRAAKAPAAPAPEPKAAPVAAPRPPVASFEAANRVPRRVPVPSLRPPLTMCKPTGVTIGAGRRVVIMPDNNGVAEALTARLQKSGAEVLRLDRTLGADALANQLQSWLAAGPIHGVYWLPALDHEGALPDMDLAAWHEAVRVRVKSLYVTMRMLYEQVATPGTFLVSATRLGGQHGYDPAGALAPLGGAVTGFTKTYKRERPDCLVKTVDFEAGRSAEDVAELLVQETLRDPGAVEIGYKTGLRWTIGLQEQPADDGQPGMNLDRNTVFLITGAAGSIVSAITADLASASGGTFYLLDLVPEPEPNNPDLKRFVTDKDGLKRELFARIQASGVRATPALVEKELAALERAHAALSAINAVRAAGGTPHYFAVNLTDAEAIGKVIRSIRERSGRIDVLLHAAGMERSHFLPAKEQREFDLVFDVKSDGWFNLLHAIGDLPLGATVAFSSIAGRFGNAGQTDYSSANDLLCKITSGFRHTRPGTRGIAIDWTAWGSIGMATRGSIPKMMEMAGIDMLPPEAGVPLIRRELICGGTRGEVVIAERIGVMMNEFDPSGGLDPEAAQVSRGPMIGRATDVGLYSGLMIETVLDPAAQAFLHDHQIDGTPVLPGVMGVEAFAEAAQWMLPGWHVEAVEGMNFLAPFKFYRGEPRPVNVQATLYPQDDGILADLRLIGRRVLPNQPEPQVTVHFTGRVRLTKTAPQAVTGAPMMSPTGPSVEARDIYKLYFHGPAYQVIERAWRTGEQIIGELPQTLPTHHQPPDRPLTMAPRLIELCFQTAGLWEMSVQGRMGLPRHIDRVRVWRSPEQAEGRIYAIVTPHPKDGNFTAEVVDTAGNRYVELCGYRTVTLPNAVDAEPLKALRESAALQVAAD